MNQSTLVKSLPIVAKALGRNMGVKVELDASHAWTDGNVIYLPSLPLQDPGVETLGLGYIIHEAGHIRYSDFSIDYAEFSPIVRKLIGIMEDIRMEKCIIRDYPGAYKKLSNLVRKLVQDDFFQTVTTDSSPAATLCGYVLHKGRSKMLGQTALNDHAKNSQAFLESVMTPLSMTRINSVMARLSAAKNEGDVVKLAQEIAQILEEESNRTTPPQNSDQSQQKQAGNDSQDQDIQTDDSQSTGESEEGLDQGDDDTHDDHGDTPSSQSDESDDFLSGLSTSSNDDISDDNGDASNGYSSSSVGEMSQEEFDTALQFMKDILATTESDSSDLPGDISDAFEHLVENEIKEAANQRGNYAVSLAPTQIANLTSPGDHQQALDEAQAATAALRSRLVQLVQAQTKVKRKTSRNGRRLNDRKLHRIKAGNLSVFKSTSRKKAVNTTVQVLLDKSYSMEDDMSIAAYVTLSLTAAMKKIPHLSVGSAMFPGYLDSSVTVLTRQNQTMDQTAGYYPLVQAEGSTPLLPALIWSGDNLFAQKEERKILFVVTDGVPDDMQDCIELVYNLRQGGIEVYGIGINVDRKMMSLLFGKEHVSIEHVGELAEATFSLLEKTVLAA
ncbi:MULTISPECIES: vWA domain-containing protein [Methylophaga]|jgi:cobalamin biosynthesis protein CobT|uniref:von Willebrand factor, type A n=1 Tax=Methylophaga aminisulfidivorans MP TaxID=1026882 RepID=F5T0W6_9GAMM|nr:MULTISPECIES: VWA domain-containing protein [Methylophaga]EGL53966.1 von Willebrand factor, type A [Methylophaga aminisulfidivorans MP]HIC46849.1 VWA domain-containing protein [Methylophaga sp.]